MKRTFICICSLCSLFLASPFIPANLAFSQSNLGTNQDSTLLPMQPDETFHEYFDTILGILISKDSLVFKNGILYDRVFPISNLTGYNADTNLNNSNYIHFINSWEELYKASFNPDFLDANTIIKLALSSEIQDSIIQVGLINVDFTSINPDLSEGAIQIVNGKIDRYTEDVESIYKNNHATVIAALNSDKVQGPQVDFEFGKIVLHKSEKLIEKLTVLHGTDSILIIENGAFVKRRFSLNFTEEGVKRIKFKVIFNDGDSLTTFSSFHVTTTPPMFPPDGIIIADSPYHGSGEPFDKLPSFYHGQGEYHIFYADSTNPVLLKPCIFVDGIDFGDKRKIDDIYNRMTYAPGVNFVDQLNEEGYDVIILNFPNYVVDSEVIISNIEGDSLTSTVDTIASIRGGGSDFIQRNARVLETLIKEVNEELSANGSSEKLVVIGPSMGALVVQYALAEMESVGLDHNTRLYISLDGPHKGANIAVGIQALLAKLDINLGLRDLNTPAAKQMLIRHYLSGESCPNGAPGFRNNFQNELDAMGFPTNCRNVAVINGNLHGIDQGPLVNSNTIFHVVRQPWMAGVGPQANIQIFRAADEGHTKVFKSRLPGIFLLVQDVPVYSQGYSYSIRAKLNEIEPLPWCSVAPLTDPIVESHLADLPECLASILIPIVQGTVSGLLDGPLFYLNYYDFTFVPTKSAIAYSGPNPHLSESFSCRNIIEEGLTPFDNLYAPEYNEPHAFLSPQNTEWALQEILELAPPPSTAYCCSVNGPQVLCYGAEGTYSLSMLGGNSGPTPPPHTWTYSGFSLIEEGPDYIKLKRVQEGTYTGDIEAYIPSTGSHCSATVRCLIPTSPLVVDEGTYTQNLDNIKPKQIDSLEAIPTEKEMSTLDPSISITAFPNPISRKSIKEVTWTFSKYLNIDLSFELYDSFGKALKQGIIPAGIKSWQLILDELPEGVYFWRLKIVNTGEQAFVGTLIVL